jgi:ABC-2 type transport system ATP-binding protein
MSVDATRPLHLEALRKAYRARRVLDGVSLDVAPGEAVAVLGANGSGKSTLLGCLTGDRLPDGGTIRICGVDPFEDPAAAARCMGFVPEQPFLYGELTVGEMLEFVAEARALPAARATSETARLLALLAMGGTETLLCRELSQGMGRKVALAAALLHEPALIVLDEALNGLDRRSVEQVVAELDRRRVAGAAVLLSSHDLDFVGEWCDRALMLAPGGVWRTLEGEDWVAWRRTPTLEPGTAGSV